MKPLFVGVFLFLISVFDVVDAVAQVPNCASLDNEPPVNFDLRGQPLSQLQKNLLVAKSADVWIHNPETGFRIWANHNFKTGIKQYNCADLAGAKPKNFSFFGPVILDRTVQQKEGSTLWQFQFLVRGTQLGIWNQKSNLVGLKQVLEQTGPKAWRWVETGPGSVRLFQLDQKSKENSILWIDFEKAE